MAKINNFSLTLPKMKTKPYAADSKFLFDGIQSCKAFATVLYRAALSRDAEALLRTRRESVLSHSGEKYSRLILEAWAPKTDATSILQESEALKNPDRISLVAEIQGNIVGFCTIGIAEGLLKQCYVLPPYRGMGIARELVIRVEDIAREKGLASLRLSSSLIALDFYQKQGYRELHSYNYDLGNDLQMPCIMMEKIL